MTMMYSNCMAFLLTLLFLITVSLAQDCALDVSSPRCQAVDCSGLICQPDAPFQNYSASYTVTNCVDPVTVNLTITPSEASLAQYAAQFVSSQTVHFGTDNNFNVQLTRNATHLDFQATIFHTGGLPVVLFPKVLVPLFPDQCMCSSLECLATAAENIHPNIESNCITTRSCTGVRCGLVISTVFRYDIEMVVLPCDDALLFLVEDSVFGTSVYQRRFEGPTSVTTPITILVFTFTLEMYIEVGNYSMIVQSFLTDSTLGRIEIIPRQIIILDKTQCNIPQFPTAPPQTLPPPATLAPDAPPLCLRFNKIVETVFDRSPIFRCMLKTNCESGLDCILSIGHEEYAVGIAINNATLGFNVSSVDGVVGYGGIVGGNVTVELPEPQGTALVFGQVTTTEAVGFALTLMFSFLTNSPQTEDLISYTLVIDNTPPGRQSPSAGTIVGVVLGVAILIVVAGLVVVGVVFFLFKRKRLSSEPFNFQKMSDLQEKELESYVKTELSNPLPGITRADIGPVKVDLSIEKD